MDKHFGKMSLEQWEAMLAAMREENIEGKNILLEIEPLIKEFFVCETIFEGNSLTLKFLNGQKFTLTATERK